MDRKEDSLLVPIVLFVLNRIRSQWRGGASFALCQRVPFVSFAFVKLSFSRVAFNLRMVIAKFVTPFIASALFRIGKVHAVCNRCTRDETIVNDYCPR